MRAYRGENRAYHLANQATGRLVAVVGRLDQEHLLRLTGHPQEQLAQILGFLPGFYEPCHRVRHGIIGIAEARRFQIAHEKVPRGMIPFHQRGEG